MSQKGFSAIIIVIAVVWLVVAAAAAVLVYEHNKPAKPYTAPADARKLPPRP